MYLIGYKIDYRAKGTRSIEAIIGGHDDARVVEGGRSRESYRAATAPFRRDRRRTEWIAGGVGRGRRVAAGGRGPARGVPRQQLLLRDEKRLVRVRPRQVRLEQHRLALQYAALPSRLGVLRHLDGGFAVILVSLRWIETKRENSNFGDT